MTGAARAADTTLGAAIQLYKPGLFKLVAKGSFPLGEDAAATGVVLTATGTDGSFSIAVPASGCTGDTTKGFRCKSPTCRLLIKPTAIKAVCKASGTLATTEAEVFTKLVVGADTYCASCGGTPAGDPAKLFKRKSCPAPPLPWCAEPTWTLGEQQVLLPSGALGGLCYFPDEAMVRVPGIPQVRFLTWAAKCRPGGFIIDDPTTKGTYLFEGPDIEHLEGARLVLSAGGPGEFDNGYAGICGLHRHTDGRLYGFYHAEDQEGLPIIPGSGLVPGYYASVGGAVSDDDGESWQKLGQVITSHKPKEWTYFPNQCCRGAAVMSAVADPTGRYLYAYWAEQSGVDANDRFVGEQVAMARADLSEGAPVPGQWKKYFGGTFNEPGLAGRNDIVLSVLQPNPSHATQPHVTYSAYLRRYVMVFGVINFAEFVAGADAELAGTYIAFSDDAVTWSTPQLLVRDWPIALVGKPVAWEANILWDDAAEQQGWFVYGYSPSWGTIGHYMVGHRIEFQ